MDLMGHQAMDYARANCPRRYAALSNPRAYFEDLGEQMRLQVDQLENDLTPPDRPNESWTTQAGRLQTGRHLAEQAVFSEMVLEAWPPEPELVSEYEDQQEPQSAQPIYQPLMDFKELLDPDENGPES
ncbi:MAG: hypothetical protein ACT4OM_13370 [Actinomycetota bacterium]